MIRLSALFLLLTTACVAADIPAVVTHEATIDFDIVRHRVSITDRVTLSGTDGPVQLDTGCFGGELTGEVSNVPADVGDHLNYAFTAHQPTEETRFSRENIGGEITATVGDEGIWLSCGGGWLPGVDDALHAGRFVIETPAGWFPVMSGSLIAQEEKDGRRRTTYLITAPVDGISLVANTYSVTEEEHGGITMRTCLLAEDTALSSLYLERTAHYLDFYSGLIGEYPYDAFTTVENWFPTGYGMPGWTLLGGQVIRLPFIPYTSFGHEIAHNWWGNSVFVDRSEGNWCEGITVFCADYEYKRQKSDEAAREYRHNQLKDYAAYIGGHPERDFPLTEFKERHSGATRAVGYGKSMAVWHMLEVELGRDVIERSFRRVYREFRGKPAVWSDFFTALETESHRDLETFRAQWLELTGAPTISLGEARATDRGVTFTLHQDGEPYDLLVPVVIDTPDGPIRETVRFDRAEQAFRVSGSGATAIAIDPDYDLFRNLHDSEIEPTLSQVLAADEWTFAAPVDDLEFNELAHQFANGFCECDDPLFTADGRPDPAAVNVIINPAPDVLAAYTPAELLFDGGMMTVAGQPFERVDYDLVFAASGPHGGTDLIVFVGDPSRLVGLSRRLPHYGKYSWLAFPVAGGRAVRGNWTPQGGPLQLTFAD